MGQFEAVAAAGSLRQTDPGAMVFPHRWTPQGVTVQTEFTGAHLLHLAAAGCVLNDVYREADVMGLRIDGVRVCASGGFDTTTWASTGITYTIDLDSPAPAADLSRLLQTVDDVAEIPRAIRAGAPVGRTSPER